MQSANILDAQSYTVGSHPYQVQEIAAEAIRELQRKREVRLRPVKAEPEEAKEPVVDVEAARQRQEAADLKLQAARLLKAAQAKADGIIAEAGVKGEEVQAKAKEEGYQEGFSRGSEEGYDEGVRKGEEAGMAKHAEATARFESLFNSAVAEKDAYLADREAIVIELATRMAAKVIAREVDTRPDHITHLLRQAIRRLQDRSKLVVSLNPEDLEKVSQARADGAMSFNGVKQIEFLADDKIMAGGLRIQSQGLTLDATLENQLTELVRGLLEETYHEA